MQEKEKKFNIHVIEDGPLQVKGDFKLISSDNLELSVDNEIYLCRCGYSANKPFCDGSHKKNVFRG